jgi:2-polyprenyl-3-methyl-5-hydroxy-6-metoxy-1,4-benzoquinol methylase
MRDSVAETQEKKAVKSEGDPPLILTMMRLTARWTGIVLKSIFDRRIDKTRSFYDMAASGYRPTPVTLTSLEDVQIYLTEADRVLDFGCADGTVSFGIAGRVREVCGIDISPGMIDAAKRKMLEKNTPNTVFIPAAIFDDQFKEGSFDVILAFNVLHAFGNGRDVVERIHGLLKPEGLFISLTPCMGESKTIVGSVLSILVRTGIFPYVRFFSIPELENLITGGGFRTSVIKRRSSHNQLLLFMVAQKITAETGPAGYGE